MSTNGGSPTNGSDPTNGSAPSNGNAPISGADEATEELIDEINIPRPPAAETRGVGPGRMGAAGMPAEKSKDFKNSTRRLAAQLRPERRGAALVLLFAVVSVTLSVLGPKLLGGATNIIFSGLSSPGGIDYTALHERLLFVGALYIVSAVLSYGQSYLLAGVVQRTMMRMRADVEDKLNRLPLSYVDRQPRGDMLSRVTNDIDNVAQSLQQTLSQLLTSSLSLIGVLTMMVIISPILALVALITIPVSIFTMRFITTRSKSRFVAQWKHTGTLNAQVEEAFTGHALVKVFGRQKDVEREFADKNEELYQASFGAQFISGTIQPAMMFLGNLNYVVIAVVGGLQVASGSLSIGDVQAFIQYSRQFTMPLTQLASMVNVLQSGIASAERVFELLDAPEQSEDALVPLEDPEPRGRGRVRPGLVLLRPREPAHPRALTRGRARPDGGDRRSDRRGQDHAREPDHAVLRARRGRHHPRRSRCLEDAPTGPAFEHRHGVAGHVAVQRIDP